MNFQQFAYVLPVLVNKLPYVTPSTKTDVVV
jgi:hypothetical protein